MLCRACEQAMKLGHNRDERARVMHDKCTIYVTIRGQRKKCECKCNLIARPILDEIKGPTIADINPRSWLSKYRLTSIDHLLIMGLFYYVSGLLLSVFALGLQYSLFGFDERYPPRSLVFAIEASPFEESLFFGIPFYATGNQYVMLGTGIIWMLFHLINTQPDVFSFSNLAYANFLFTVLPFFFAFRTWKSGKGWFSILFHLGWDFCIVGLLMFTGNNHFILFSNDSYAQFEIVLIPIIPVLLLLTYQLYKRREKRKNILGYKQQ